MAKKVTAYIKLQVKAQEANRVRHRAGARSTA